MIFRAEQTPTASLPFSSLALLVGRFDGLLVCSLLEHSRRQFVVLKMIKALGACQNDQTFTKPLDGLPPA